MAIGNLEGIWKKIYINIGEIYCRTIRGMQCATSNHPMRQRLATPALKHILNTEMFQERR